MSASGMQAAKTSAGYGGTSRGGAAVAAFDARVDTFFEAHLRGHKGIDLVMYGASALGEHSFIWLLLSGTKAWRTKAGWGALMRAGSLLAAESVLVNGIVKSFFRRRRPEPVAPRPLPLRTPRSSSFPSGHASAAFFSAALLRGSGRKWPLYALAVVVSTSRVHVKIHHASDVVGGAAFGAALGEVVRRRRRLS